MSLRVEDVVLEVLKKYWPPPIREALADWLTGRPRRVPQKTDRLFGDLWGLGWWSRYDDDVSFLLAYLEKQFRVQRSLE